MIAQPNPPSVFRFVLRYLLALVLVPLCYIPAFLIASRAGPPGLSVLLIVLLVSLTMAALFAVVMIRWHGWPFSAFGLQTISPRTAAFWFVIPLIVALPTVFAAQAGGEKPPEFIQALGSSTSFMLFVVGASIQEEFIFRGAILATIRQELAGKLWPLPIIFAGLLFGSLHLAVGPITAIVATFLGILAGYARFRTGSIIAAILCHAAFNLASLLMG